MLLLSSVRRKKISYHQVRVLDGCQNCSYFPSLNSFDQWGDKQWIGKGGWDTPAMVFWNDWSFFLVTELRVPFTDLDLTLSDLSRATEEKRGWLSTRPTFWLPSLITWINKNPVIRVTINPSVVSYIESETKIDMSFTIILAMFLKPSHLNIVQTEILWRFWNNVIPWVYNSVRLENI